MRLAHAVKVGSWVLVGLNLLMAVGTIAIFSRMAPAIAVIIDRNERTLEACEEMLAILAVKESNTPFTQEEEKTFRNGLFRAENNITESQEPLAVEQIKIHLSPLIAGDGQVRRQAVNAITHLARINREAMILADRHAQHLGRTGAWGVAFMAISAFLAGVIFIRSLTRRVVIPLEEIHTVINAHRTGETMRRCTGLDLAQDVAAVFTGINEILDRSNCASGFSVENEETSWPVQRAALLSDHTEVTKNRVS